jgi:hypothetical protein
MKNPTGGQPRAFQYQDDQRETEKQAVLCKLSLATQTTEHVVHTP